MSDTVPVVSLPLADPPDTGVPPHPNGPGNSQRDKANESSEPQGNAAAPDAPQLPTENRFIPANRDHPYYTVKRTVLHQYFYIEGFISVDYIFKAVAFIVLFIFLLVIFALHFFYLPSKVAKDADDK